MLGTCGLFTGGEAKVNWLGSLGMRSPLFEPETWLSALGWEPPLLLRAFHTPLMQHVTTVTHTATTRTHSSTTNPATLDGGTEVAAVELTAPV